MSPEAIVNKLWSCYNMLHDDGAGVWGTRKI